MSTKLTKGGNKAIRNLVNLKDKTAAEALKIRGGAGSALKQGRSDYWSKSLGEIANLEAKGDQDARTIMKLVKAASKKAQKYGGK
ncbi:MAG: hypothetical protein GY830_03905 [Bacteroidetes bacterium]|nr:hypothetical protein [Bacteroidota bacterium]